MKTKLKILYKTPDLDALAEKHQDFDALMDAHLDEKIRRRKKLYRFSSFAIVIIGTAFLSWLYWGYEPDSSQTDLVPPQETPTVVSEGDEMKPEEAEQLKEQVQESEPVTETPPATLPEKTDTPLAREVNETVERPKSEEDELALPSVTITSTERISAKPAAGLEHLYSYLYSKVDLPDSVLDENGSFFLEVSFTVQENGDISNVLFNKELPEAVAASMKEIIENMPEWQPARQGEDAVDSDVKLPITFQKKD